jgi:hypothetical protein
MMPAPGACSRGSWVLPAALAAAVALPWTTCHRDIRLLATDDGSAGAGMGGAAGAGLGGEAGVGGAAGSSVACSLPGGPIELPTASGPTCAAALETRGHRFALCACDTLTIGARLRTDSFDSSNSGGDDQVSAAVGTNGALVTTAELEAEGAIYVADPAGASAGAHLQAGGSFRSAGPLAMLSSKADLLSDAYVNGDLTGTVKVSGILHLPATAARGAGVEAQKVATEAVTVLPPCDCNDSVVDVTSAITTAMTDNGDAAAGFNPAALSNVLTATQLTLGCGTYYLASIGATAAPVTLVVHGHALLAVQGSVSLGGGLTVTLDPSAELDLLVGGWFTTSGNTVGAPAAPARFRIWIGGTESLVFDHQPTIAAVIHAPGSPATAPLGLALSGSLLVKSLSLGADSLLHYDRAILSAGVPCGEPPAPAVP